MNEDGTMARLPELIKLAKKHQLKIISIEDLIDYQLKKGDLIHKIESRSIHTAYGDFDFHAFQEEHTEQIHFALTKGSWNIDEPVLVRVQSSNDYFDVLQRITHGEKPLLERITKQINAEGKGALVFINNVSNAENTLRKLQLFNHYQDGKTHHPTKNQYSEYGIGTQILKSLGITKFKIITQHPELKPSISGYGVEITEMVKLIK